MSMSDTLGVNVPLEEEEDDTGVPWTLDTLPVEVLLHITTFIPAPTLIHSLSLVSKHFHQILSNEKTWEIRGKKMWPGNFPPMELDNPSPFLHRLATLKREEAVHLWSQSVNNCLVLSPHIACVDSVLLFKGNSMLATGSRDRSMTLTNIDNCIENSTKTVDLIKNNAHTGWIWDLTVVNNQETLVSAGWDGFVKFWDMASLQETGEFKTGSPNLCLSAESNLLSIGSFDSRIHIYDVRTGTAVKNYKAHKRSVLAIGLENGKLVSAGEDNRIALHDLRMDKVVSSFGLPQSPNNTPKIYPKSISYANTNASNPLPYFYVGDIRGNLYLINLPNFKIERCYPRIHTQAVQGVFHTLGCVYTCSSDGQLIIFEPSAELGIVKKIHLQKVELPKVHCLNNRVALAGGDSLIRVYYT